MSKKYRKPTDADFMRISLAIAGIEVDNASAEMLLEIARLVDRKKGSGSVNDIVSIEFKIKKKYNIKN